MNNDPAKIAAVLRSLAVYAACIIVAVIIGVLMTNPLTYSALGFVGLVCAVLFLPILLRYHYFLMIASWSTPITVFFLKGDPKLSLVMIALSMVISVTAHTLNQQRFINVPSIKWSLICLIAVVLITAKFTGGFGLKAFGSEVYGGKKYVFLIVAILGYFALVAQPIPTKRARLYVTLFFAGGVLGFIGDLYQISPGFLHPIFWIFPPSAFDPNFTFGSTRLVGTGWAGTAMINVLIARYSLRGIFFTDKLWRPALFFFSIALIFLGGFRSALLLTGMTIMLQFFLEGLHRTKLLLVFALIGFAGIAAIFPLAPKLPYTFQRTLAFLPKEIIHLTPEARLEAQGSTDWRLDMWKALLPQVPKHLLLGKGYAITMEDLELMGQDSAFQNGSDASQQGLALSGDYHNGPLSVILPFGIWGVLAFTWFLTASLRVMYLNYRYSSPELQTLNTFLFTIYTIGSLDFVFLFGGLADGMGQFTGLLGLSIAINRGVCRAPVRPAHNVPFNIRFRRHHSHPQPALPRATANENSL
jgi:O-Antigen ligase